MTSEAMALARRHPALPYVLPFAVFLILLGLGGYLTFLGRAEAVIRISILITVLYVFSRDVIDLRCAFPVGSLILGVAVFGIWIAPDLLLPGYRDSLLFQNALTGKVQTSIPVEQLRDPFVLTLRTFRAVILVPIIEELFWRAFLMRWLISSDFLRIPLGAYSAPAMIITALLFAAEHGPFWDVGLIAGLLYNWWMIRTLSLGDCILAHAVTNACLCAYVLATQRWEYWL